MVCKLNRDYQGNPKFKKMVSKQSKKNKKGGVFIQEILRVEMMKMYECFFFGEKKGYIRGASRRSALLFSLQLIVQTVTIPWLFLNILRSDFYSQESWARFSPVLLRAYRERSSKPQQGNTPRGCLVITSSLPNRECHVRFEVPEHERKSCESKK